MQPHAAYSPASPSPKPAGIMVPLGPAFPLSHHPLVERLLTETAGRAAAALLARALALAEPLGPAPLHARVTRWLRHAGRP